MKKKIAVIDIGSNSVRLMLWANGKTLYKKVISTRLAEGLAESGYLSESAISRTHDAIYVFYKEAARKKATLYAFATAAVRSAKNGTEFCMRTKEAFGINVDVISGKDEAQLGVLGALGNNDGGIIDIGGASTEVCLRKSKKTVFSMSTNIGAVRLYDMCKEDMNCTVDVVKSALRPLDGVFPAGKTYAIGGTAATLAAIKAGIDGYDAKKLHGVALPFEWVRGMADRLFPMTTEERSNIVGMDLSRIDVIAGATYVLYEVMKKLSCDEVIFSDSDNLEGYLTFRGLI